MPKKEKDATKKRNSVLSRFLSAVERIGNALPHPATLFAILAFGLILLSWLTSKVGLAAINPRDGVAVLPINLVSRDGLHWILEHTIDNFTGFAPLGTVLVAMLGIGVAEKSGLISTGLRLMVHAAPRKLLTFVIVFAGVMSNLASDVGYVLLVPMGAIIFLGGLLAGLAYGIATGTFRSDADVVKGMKESMESLGLYMVLVFFAAQFVAFVQGYDSKAGIGTVIATMLPYSIAFLVVWMALLVVWLLLGLPLGPGAELYL